jgi:hypothetical protein
MDADADLEHLLQTYACVCREAGVEPLPPDEAREQAQVLMRLLVPAFEVSFRQH